MAQVYGARWIVQENAVDGSLQDGRGGHAAIVLISPTQQEFYMG